MGQNVKKIGIVAHSGFVRSTLTKAFKAKSLYGLSSKTLAFNSLA
jgi:hypothetical protein